MVRMREDSITSSAYLATYNTEQGDTTRGEENKTQGKEGLCCRSKNTCERENGEL